MNDEKQEGWLEQFNERSQALIHSCRQYMTDGAPGLPGHQLMLIVAQMAAMLETSRFVLGTPQEEQGEGK